MAVTASTSEKKCGMNTIETILGALDYFSSSSAGIKLDTLAEYTTALAAIIAIRTKFNV